MSLFTDFFAQGGGTEHRASSVLLPCNHSLLYSSRRPTNPRAYLRKTAAVFPLFLYQEGQKQKRYMSVHETLRARRLFFIFVCREKTSSQRDSEVFVTARTSLEARYVRAIRGNSESWMNLHNRAYRWPFLRTTSTACEERNTRGQLEHNFQRFGRCLETTKNADRGEEMFPRWSTLFGIQGIHVDSIKRFCRPKMHICSKHVYSRSRDTGFQSPGTKAPTIAFHLAVMLLLPVLGKQTAVTSQRGSLSFRTLSTPDDNDAVLHEETSPTPKRKGHRLVRATSRAEYRRHRLR